MPLSDWGHLLDTPGPPTKPVPALGIQRLMSRVLNNQRLRLQRWASGHEEPMLTSILLPPGIFLQGPTEDKDKRDVAQSKASLCKVICLSQEQVAMN